MNILIILNLILTSALFVFVVRQRRRAAKPTRASFEETVASAADVLDETMKWIELEKRARLPKPIQHPKVEGPTTSSLTRVHGYWRPKAEPKAEPFLAAWYEKDMTVGTHLRLHGYDDEAIPADTYVDLLGRKIPGATFREHYEPAEAVVVVSQVKSKTRLHNSNLVTSSAASAKLSPEEEQQLAEEYELGVHVTDQAS